MPLKILGKEKLFQGKFRNFWSTNFLDKDGNERVWEWVDSKDFVYVFGITTDKKIIVVKNFRIPIEKYVIQMVAGRIDNDNESEEETAKRELLEETGYSAANLIRLNHEPALPGTSNSYAKNFIATGCKKVSDSHGDETEDITVIEIEADKFMDYFLNLKEDVLFSYKIIALFAIAKAKGLI